MGDAVSRPGQKNTKTANNVEGGGISVTLKV